MRAVRERGRAAAASARDGCWDEAVALGQRRWPEPRCVTSSAPIGTRAVGFTCRTDAEAIKRMRNRPVPGTARRSGDAETDLSFCPINSHSLVRIYAVPVR